MSWELRALCVLLVEAQYLLLVEGGKLNAVINRTFFSEQTFVGGSLRRFYNIKRSSWSYCILGINFYVINLVAQNEQSFVVMRTASAGSKKGKKWFVYRNSIRHKSGQNEFSF